jgi:hypothetical protein
LDRGEENALLQQTKKMTKKMTEKNVFFLKKTEKIDVEKSKRPV